MEHRMKSLFESIKEDELKWMDKMIAFQEEHVPSAVRENPVTEKLLAVALVVGLVPAGLKSLLENL
jgi:hypothetical protein